MTPSARFPYIERDAAIGDLSRMPFLPLELAANGLTVPALAMLDTGSAVNVLPYALGRALEFVWEQQTTRIQLRVCKFITSLFGRRFDIRNREVKNLQTLSGSLGEAESRAVALPVTIAPFAPVLLVFAWTQAENAPLLLGQMNFFQEFDVCFFRAQGFFEITPRLAP